MSHQLTYVLITPHSVRKGRTGGILSRLISQSGLELVGGRFFNPSEKLAQGLAASLNEQELTAHYLNSDSFFGEQRQLLALLFQGADAIKKISAIVGDDESMDGRGETLRDIYSEHFLIEVEEEENADVFYFEPGIIAPTTLQEAQEGLALLAAHSDQEGGILDVTSEFAEGTALEKTLVLIKPDNFKFPNMRPGAIIDLLARTGLALVGFKVQNMSVAQAKEFYGPVLEVLEAKLPDGRIHWESIIAFMSGARPSEYPEEKHAHPGTERCIALIYQGEDAVRKIREVLGPTDPSKAPHGTIRKEFGQNIMVNSAHASDSKESFLREIGIIHIEENNFKKIITS
ncbi:MAG: nucleoside-diphosphate kinase [Chthoniobacterales bacterium]|nr:nucleoside-diphosphate kinase [Chthoniobacterales bacterium]